MSNVIVYDRIQLRQGTAADLASVNEVLLAGEPCVETDTGKYKIGDGYTAWNSLPYQGIWTTGDIQRALDLLGSATEGDIIYKGSSGWSLLAKGSNDQVLTLAAGLPAWKTATGVSGGMALVGQAEVSGSATTSITVNDLDLNSDERYIIVFGVKNATAGALNLNLFFNGDETVTNYAYQRVIGVGNTVSASRDPRPLIATVSAGNCVDGQTYLSVDVNGYPRTVTQSVRDNTSDIIAASYATVWNSTANVVSLTLSADQTNGLAPGTYIKVYSMKSGAPLTQTITDGDITHAPSGDAVHDALALKGNINAQTWTGSHRFNGPVQFRGSNVQFIGENLAIGYQAVVYGSTAPQQVLTRAGGSEAVPSATPVGNMGAFSFRGHDGTVLTGSRAFIQAFASEAWTGTGNGTELRFQTTPNGSTTMGTSLVIDGDGNVRPWNDNTQNFGTAGSRIKELFAGNSTINTSDAREKTPLRPFTPVELAAAREIAGNIGIYQWLASIEEKGDDARLHVGVIAQQVASIFALHGLDAERYGLFCYDEWPETVEPAQYEEIDGEQVLVREAVTHPAGNRYGVRGVQLSMFLIAAQEQRLRALETA